METKTIANFEFTLDEFQGTFAFVHISIDGKYWDSKEFPNIAEARAFFDDPLADDRAVSKRKNVVTKTDTRFLDSVGIRDIYRRTARV